MIFFLLSKDGYLIAESIHDLTLKRAIKPCFFLRISPNIQTLCELKKFDEVLLLNFYSVFLTRMRAKINLNLFLWQNRYNQQSCEKVSRTFSLKGNLYTIADEGLVPNRCKSCRIGINRNSWIR